MFKLIIFGIGNSLKKLEKIINLNHVEIICYCDNNIDKIGAQYNKKKVITPNELYSLNFDYILIAPRGVLNRKSIFNQLINLGISTDKIIDFYDFLNPVEYKIKMLEESDDYDTIITGLSYAQYGIDINHFASKTINMSSESQDLYFDYKILKMVLDKYKTNNKFRNVIMCLSYFSFQYDLSKCKFNLERVLMYYSTFHDLHNYNKDVNSYLIRRKDMYEKCEKIFVSDFEKIIDDLPDNVLTESQIISNKDLPKIDSNKNYPKTVEENKSIFADYMELLQQHNIIPIVVVFPTTKYYYDNFSKRLEDEFLEIINYYQSIYKFEFYDFFRSELFDNNDFVDISHLNKAGAKKMSKILNKIILDKNMDHNNC